MSSTLYISQNVTMDHGMMSLSSPSRTRISTTSTSQSVNAGFGLLEVKALGLGGEVEAMSITDGVLGYE
jgi:hypothetical protein